MKRLTQHFWLILSTAVMAGSLAPSNSAFAENASRRDLSVEQAPIANCGEGADAPSSNIQVSATLNHADGLYGVGDTLTLQVRASQDAYITVLEVGTSGKVHIIFPNRYQENNRVSANEIVAIPSDESHFRIRVGGPAGRDVIKVFATYEPLSVLARQRLVQEGAYYTTPQNARSLARDLTVELHEKHKSEFGTSTQIFEIVNRDGRNAYVEQSMRNDGGPVKAPLVQGGSGGSGGNSSASGAGTGGKGGDAILCQNCILIPK